MNALPTSINSPRSNRILILLFTFCLGFVVPTEAAILLSEDFSYANGMLNGNGSAADGWSGAWNQFSEHANIVNGQLILPPSGDDDSFRRSFDQIPGLSVGESRYFAIDFTVVNNSSVFATRFSMNFNNVGGVPGTFWGIGTTNGGSEQVFDINGPGVSTVAPVSGETYRLVSRGTKTATGSVITLWIDPTSDSSIAAAESTFEDSSNFILGVAGPMNRLDFSYENLTDNDFQFDNFVLATTFEEALGATASAVPEPGSLLLWSACIFVFLIRGAILRTRSQELRKS